MRIRDGDSTNPGWKKVGSGIRDKHPRSATLVKTGTNVHLSIGSWGTAGGVGRRRRGSTAGAGGVVSRRRWGVGGRHGRRGRREGCWGYGSRGRIGRGGRGEGRGGGLGRGLTQVLVGGLAGGAPHVSFSRGALIKSIRVALCTKLFKLSWCSMVLWRDLTKVIYILF